MSVNQMIPSIWSARILQKLNDTLVFGQPGVVNRDYEGEISGQGSEVYVHSFSEVSTAPYNRNSTTLQYEQLQDARTTLQITESDYFAVKLDDLDAAQMKPAVMDQVSQDAAYQLAKVQDTFLSGFYADAGQTLDDGGTARTITSANAYETFVEAGEMLDDNNVPSEGRYAIVPPFVASALLLDDKYFLKASQSSVLNGSVGSVAGINVLRSNRVNSGTSVFNCIVGHPSAISYAQQISKTEGLRAVDNFSDLLRGLTLYGAKTVRPECLINLRASKA